MRITEIIVTEKKSEDANIPKVTKEDYGQEAIFDIHNVSAEFFTKKTIRKFAEKLCDEISMRRGPNYLWGEDKEEHKNNKGEGAIKADGISCIQFLYSSSITMHCLDEISKVFINIFSCNKFDFDKAKKFIEDNINGNIVEQHNIVRK